MNAAAPAPGAATAGHGVPCAEAVRVWLRVAAPLTRGASVFAVPGGCALAGVLLHAAGFG